MFQLDPLELMDGLIDYAVTDSTKRDTFFRGVWTILSEPEDAEAADLIEQYGAEAALMGVLEGTLRPKDPARWLSRYSPGLIETTFRTAKRHGIKLLGPRVAGWPPGLMEAMAPLGGTFVQPHALWWRGQFDALLSLNKSVAIVGSRAATGYGQHVAMEMASKLGEMGYAIVSGAAYGIDGMAHRAALASGKPTIAFLAGGVDRFYPAGHDALLTRIAEVGVVMSEAYPGQSTTKWRFLARNRLIAAVSQGMVVAEAGFRSGTLNAARRASELGRPVMAVPGPITSAASAGCHELIRTSGATLVTNADEVDRIVRHLP